MNRVKSRGGYTVMPATTNLVPSIIVWILCAWKPAWGTNAACVVFVHFYVVSLSNTSGTLYRHAIITCTMPACC